MIRPARPRRGRFLITGVSSGIGLETARALVARGASVLGAVRGLARAEVATASVRAAARDAGGSLELVALDRGSLQSVRAGADNLSADGRALVGGKYLEDVAVASIDDTPNPFADGVRSYALDADRAEQLWARTVALISAAL